MKTFFKDLIAVQTECTKKSLGFWKTHPVGFTIMLIGSFFVPFIPYIVVRIENKVQLKKIEKNID